MFQLIYLTLWMASSIVQGFTGQLYQSIPSQDIEFQLYEYQPESLSVKLDHNLNAVSSAVDSLETVLSTILNTDIESETKVNSTRATPKTLAHEILHNRQMNNEFRLQALVKSLKSTIKTLKSENNVRDAEKILAELVDTFFYGESPFYRYPALAVPTLFSLASFVETFAETLIAQNHPLAKTTSVPCDLADTLSKYFIPTLKDRLDRIDITSDYKKFSKYNKYIYSEKTANQSFESNRVEDFVKCVRADGDKVTYKLERKQFGGAKKIATKSPNLFTEEINKADTGYLILKDNFGNEDQYYYFFDVENEPCARGYFSLVRQRLESEFEQARSKVLRVCPIELRERKRHPTGFGWLSIKVGSLLAERLKNGKPCKLNKLAGLMNNFCDPYVKMTVEYELNGRRLKVEHQTEAKEHAAGWTSVEETFHFDKIPKNSTIDIEILNVDEQQIFSETTTIPLFVNRILLENSNSKLVLTSSWRDEAL